MVLKYNRCVPNQRVSEYFVRYQVELWETTFFFSRNIVYFQFSHKLGHPLEDKKDEAIAAVKEDLRKNLNLVRTGKIPYNNTYVLLPRWRGNLETAKKKNSDHLSGCFFVDDMGFSENMLDDYVDFPDNKERKKLNGFLDALRDCVSFDAGIQHILFNKGEPFHDRDTLPSICPCGHLLGNWRKKNNLVGRKEDDTFDPLHEFPFCTSCDDGFANPTCYVTPKSLLRHLYVKANTCPLHLLTLTYLFRLYKDVPYVEQYSKKPQKKFESVTWEMHNLEKQNSTPQHIRLYEIQLHLFLFV